MLRSLYSVDVRVGHRQLCHEFNQRHPNWLVQQSTIIRLLRKFKPTGSVANLPWSGRPRTSPEVCWTVLAKFTPAQKSPYSAQVWNWAYQRALCMISWRNRNSIYILYNWNSIYTNCRFCIVWLKMTLTVAWRWMSGSLIKQTQMTISSRICYSPTRQIFIGMEKWTSRISDTGRREPTFSRDWARKTANHSTVQYSAETGTPASNHWTIRLSQYSDRWNTPVHDGRSAYTWVGSSGRTTSLVQ